MCLLGCWGTAISHLDALAEQPKNINTYMFHVLIKDTKIMLKNIQVAVCYLFNFMCW